LQISSFKKIDIFILLIALCFSGKYLVVNNWESHADDFASIYVAAQLLADGKPASIYDHHPYLFHIVPDGEFKETAQKIGFRGTLHPYVHLPLISFLFRPFLFIPYRIIIKLLLLVNFLAVLISLNLILKLLGRGFNLRWFSITILATTYFFPLRYGLWLGQTSPLVFLGITVLYCLVKAGYLKTSGCILGGIISLKITPIFLLLYFLMRKKRPLVISSVITVIIIGICSVIFVGWESNIIFLKSIIRLSKFSLASWNNQSLDGFLLRWVTDASHIYDWHLLTLPFKAKMVKYLVLSFMFLLWFIILSQPIGTNEKNREDLDFSLTLILLVIFAPISWSHYLLFLVFPYGVLLTNLIQNKTMSYRRLMIGGLIFSFLGVALPPSYLGITHPPLYFLVLVNFPLIHKVPLPVLSSSGFVGGMLLIIIIFIFLLSRRGHKRLRTTPHEKLDRVATNITGQYTKQNNFHQAMLLRSQKKLQK